MTDTHIHHTDTYTHIIPPKQADTHTPHTSQTDRHTDTHTPQTHKYVYHIPQR